MNVHIDDHGSGAPVVLLHGMPSALDDFAPLVGALSRRGRVLVPHLPGYGRTPPVRGGYSVEGVVDALERQLLARGVGEAAFVGFSGGAYKAVALALRGVIRPTRMVLLSPALGFDPDAAAGVRALAAAARGGAFDPRPTWLDRMASPGLASRDPSAAARVLAWLDAVPLDVLCDELVAAADAPDLRGRTRELSCPVLVCAGTEDRAVPPDASAAVAAGCARGIWAPIEAAGHASLVEAPGAVVRLVADFLHSG